MRLWPKRKEMPDAGPPPVTPDERRQAQEERVQSELVAARVRGDNAKVRALAELLRAHRLENGFSEILSQTLRDVR